VEIDAGRTPAPPCFREKNRFGPEIAALIDDKAMQIK
jgi:hypothetical protein